MRGLFCWRRYTALFPIATRLARAKICHFRSNFTSFSPSDTLIFILHRACVRCTAVFLVSVCLWQCSIFLCLSKNTLFCTMSHRCALRLSYPTLFIYPNCSYNRLFIPFFLSFKFYFPLFTPKKGVIPTFSAQIGQHYLLFANSLFSYFNSYNFYLQVIPIFLFWLIFPKTLSRGLSLAVPHLVLNACHRFVLFNPVSGVAIPRITSFRPTLIIRSFTSQTIRYVFTKTLANHVRNV